MNEQNIQNLSSYAGNQQAVSGVQQPVNSDAESVKQMAVNDLKTIKNLVQSGVMTQEQGAQQQPVAQQQTQLQTNVSTPDFFNQDGRIDVYDYLRNSNIALDQDELSKISALVEKIEKTAIEKYLRELQHEKTLNSENETAKQRLRANAQNSGSDGVKNLVFTREQIGKMSGAEFAKYESAIMDQLRKGLIK